MPNAPRRTYVKYAPAKRGTRTTRAAAATRAKPSAAANRTAVTKAPVRYVARRQDMPAIPRSIFAMMDVHAWNPFDPRIYQHDGGRLATPNSMGNATWLRSSAELTRTTGTGQEIDFIVMMYTASDAKVFFYYANGTANQISHTLLQGDPPKLCRPGRVGLKLSNVTRAEDVCGLVSCYTSTEPLELSFTSSTSGQITPATVQGLNALMADSGKVVKLPAQEFVKGKEFWLTPASHQQYVEWQPFRSLAEVPNTETLVLGFGLQRCPMSVCVIGLHDSSASQRYHIHSVTEDWLRYSSPSLGAAMAEPQPSADMTEFARAARDRNSMA